MLTQLFLAARRENRPPLPYVRQLVRSGLLQAAERLHLLDPELATQFLDVPIDRLNLNDRFLLSAWSTLSARLRPLLTDSVVRCFNGSDFTAQDLLLSDRPVTVYLRWKERDLLALSPLVRLFWKSFTDELTDTYDARDGRGCHPVLFLIDEAGRTAIPSLSDAATTVVGRGISLWISVQSLSQLEAEYGKARAETLLDNMDTQLYYRPGNRPGHQTTAELLERALGDSSGFAESRTSRHGHDASEARSEQAVPLLSAWELRQLHDEDVIGFHRGLPPFRMTRMDWRALPLFSKRATIPPPLLAPLPQEDVPSPVELGVAARSQAACLL
jgi:type IV secretory pathway TraG/TraD family ATPase VirD4